MAGERVRDGGPAGDTRSGEPRWLDAREQQVWRAWLDVSRLLTDRLQRRLVEDDDLSLAEYEILVQLSEHPQRALRMFELAERVVHSRSRLTHTVSRMQERGYVRREPYAGDGRGVVCVLTDEGMAAIVAAAPDHVATVREAFFDPLTRDDVAALGRALGKMRDRLRAGD